MVTRRMLFASALGGAALPLLAKGRIDLSRVSAITDEIARSSADAVKFVQQYGLKWVELRNVPGQRKEYIYLDEAELRAEAKLLDEAKLRVSFLNSSLLKVTVPGIEPVGWAKALAEGKTTAEKLEARRKSDAVKWERRMEDLKKGIRAAKILGTDKLRVFTGWRGADVNAVMPRIAEIINEMAVVAEKEKIHLLIENEGACNVGSCAELAALLKMVPSKYVGLNWDPMNGMHFNEQPYPEGYQMLPKHRIANVQIKGKTVLDYPEKLDWRAILDGLVRDGYKGQVGLETHIFGDGQIQASHDSMKVIVGMLKA
ncbi:MAG: sugar phosphate isomerase/epimerase [Bryobacterales bacterium]|nr:sugar phosphate isomerase/epimerase [Bryobacterales bacterium]